MKRVCQAAVRPTCSRRIHRKAVDLLKRCGYNARALLLQKIVQDEGAWEW
jgi:hypothetical protein